MEDGSDLEAEGLICLPGQIDIRSYMLPTKPIMDFTADEEVAREMGLDFSLEEQDRGLQNDFSKITAYIGCWSR